MKYFIGIVPPTDQSEQIDELRRKYPGRHLAHIDPHITLIPPLEFTETPFDWLQMIEQTLAEIQPFSIQLGQPGFFSQRVLFLNVHILRAKGKESNALHRMYEKMQSVTEPYRTQASQYAQSSRNGSFHPHLTVAMASFGTSFSVMTQMYADATVLSPLFDPFIVRSVRVFVKTPERWIPYRDINLAK